MRTCITLPYHEESTLRSPFEDDCGPQREGLIRLLLEEYTHTGDVVFDPFAGNGEVLRTAEKMGRVPFGLDCDRKRVEYTRSRLNHVYNIIHGDPRKLTSFGLPVIDFSFTSPPHAPLDAPQSPLPNPNTQAHQGGYLRYLSDLQTVYNQLAQCMRPGAFAAIEVSNVRTPLGLTPFAWDIGIMVSEALSFEGEIVVNWEPSYGYGYDHSYCLLFRKPTRTKGKK